MNYCIIELNFDQNDKLGDNNAICGITFNRI